MNRLNLFAVKLTSFPLLWTVTLLTLMLAALAAGAPESPSCGTLAC